MKIYLLFLFFFAFGVACYGQSAYDLTGGFRTIKKDKLSSAKSLNDLIPNYPANWISAYTKVEIMTTHNGLQKKAVGYDNILTELQKKDLALADALTNVLIKVSYLSKNSLSGQIEPQTMEVSFYVAPDVNARFDEGISLNDYLRKSLLGSARDTIPKRLSMITVKFTVSEDGAIMGASVFKSSGDMFTDMRLLQAIKNLPKWKPAENEGVRIKQDFLFSFGGC